MLLCALVLLAQLGAATHAILHAAADAPAEELEVSAYEQSGPDSKGLSTLCAFDAAFGQVLAGAPISHHAFALRQAASGIAPHVAYRVVVTHRLAPRSRGPPALI